MSKHRLFLLLICSIFYSQSRADNLAPLQYVANNGSSLATTDGSTPQDPTEQATPAVPEEDLGKQVYIPLSLEQMQATTLEIKTSAGSFTMDFYPKFAPQNISNFLQLAAGTRVFTELNGKKAKRPFYTGLEIFRVLPNNYIQFGCPRNNGKGGPGYTQVDEPSDLLKFDRPGVVAMSNYGKDTNGSQIFITLKPMPELDGKYTIIGQIKSGLDVARKISSVKANGLGKPTTPIVIEGIRLQMKEVQRGLSSKGL